MESMDQLNGYDAAAFEAWLDKHLRQIYEGTPEEKYRACDFRHLDIPRGESHLEALQSLFKRLSADAREQFMQALERILRHAKPGDFPGDAMADIVSLVGLTKAYVVFPAFVPVLGGGPWGKRKPSLLYDALAVLMMFDRSNEAYETAKGLAASIYFPNALVFDAYLVMTRGRPENWRGDFVLLRDRFNKIIQDVIDSKDADLLEQLRQRQLSLTLSLSKISLFELGKRLATLKFTPILSPQVGSDNWLCDGLLEHLGLAWKDDDIDQQGNIYEMDIFDRANPSRKATLETTPAFELCFISHGLDKYNYKDKDAKNPVFFENTPSSEQDKKLDIAARNRQYWSNPANQTMAV